MQKTKTYTLYYDTLVNTYGDWWPTDYYRVDVEINPDAIESITEKMICFWKVDKVVKMEPTWFGFGKPKEVPTIERNYSLIEVFNEITMMSGEKYLVKKEV